MSTHTYANPKTISEAQLQRDTISCAKANGWRWDIEDCFPQAMHRSSAYLQQHFKTLQKPLNWLLKRRQNLFTLAYHTFDSRNSQPGFPDLVLVHPRRGEIIFAEIKKEDDSYPTTEQRLWLAALQSATYDTPHINVTLWRPSDWPEIVEALGGTNIPLKG